MKKLLITTLFLCISFLGFCQLAETFEDASKQGISPHVDSVYMSAVDIDSNKAAFKGRYKEFMNAYTDMLQKLADYLYKNGFKCGASFSYFNRIYFKADGSIDYYLYKFKAGTIDEQKEKEFNRLLNLFVKEYKFPLSARENFAQCSPVVLSDPMDKK